MVYLGLVALCLGLIAVFITIQYMNSSDKINKELKTIRTKFINVRKKEAAQEKMIQLLSELQQKTGLKLQDIYSIVMSHQKKISEKINLKKKSKKNPLLKKESFKNYSPGLESKNTELLYTSAKSRGLELSSENLKKILNLDKIKELKEIVTNYDDVFKKTFERINMLATMGDSGHQQMNNEFQQEKKYQKQKGSKKKCSASKNLNKLKNLKIPFAKLKYCRQKHNGRNYCFRIPKDSLCKKGKIVTKLDKCDFY